MNISSSKKTHETYEEEKVDCIEQK